MDLLLQHCRLVILHTVIITVSFTSKTVALGFSKRTLSNVIHYAIPQLSEHYPTLSLIAPSIPKAPVINAVYMSLTFSRLYRRNVETVSMHPVYIV